MERAEVSKRTGAVVVVAGLSSRMDGFKPLLPLGDKTIIERVVETLLASGIEIIVMVTGYRSEEIEQLLSKQPITFVRNEKYADTQMFESVKIGLKELSGKCSQFFFLPGDLPLFRQHTLCVLSDAMRVKKACVAVPAYSGKRGHPILIAEEVIGKILAYEGESGLKGALACLDGPKLELVVPDPAVLMDADTIQDYRILQKYQTELEYPSPEVCLKILQWFEADDKIIEHGQAVAQAAQEIADELAVAGHLLNHALLRSAALLHDVARQNKDHATCGADWLRQLGYPAVAQVVAAHMDLPEEAIEQLDERAILYIADKLVIGNRRVQLDERFAQAYTRFENDPDAAQAVKERKDKAQRILMKIRKQQS